MPTIDFTDAEDFSALDPGVYGAEITKAELKTSSKGNQMIALTLAITDEPYLNRKVFDNLVLTPKALWKVKATMVSLGWDADDLEGEIEVDPDDFIGLACRVRTSVGEYQGREQTRVDDVLPYDVEED